MSRWQTISAGLLRISEASETMYVSYPVFSILSWQLTSIRRVREATKISRSCVILQLYHHVYSALDDRLESFAFECVMSEQLVIISRAHMRCLGKLCCRPMQLALILRAI